MGKGPPGAGDVGLAQRGRAAALDDSAGQCAPLDVGPGRLGGAARVRDGDARLRGGHGTLQQLRMAHAHEERGARGARERCGRDEPGQRPPESRLPEHFRRRHARATRGRAIAQQLLIAAIQLREQAADETGGVRGPGDAVVNPLSLPLTLDAGPPRTESSGAGKCAARSERGHARDPPRSARPRRTAPAAAAGSAHPRRAASGSSPTAQPLSFNYCTNL